MVEFFFGDCLLIPPHLPQPAVFWRSAHRCRKFGAALRAFLPRLFSLVHYQYFVRIHDRTHPLGHDNDGRILRTFRIARRTAASVLKSSAEKAVVKHEDIRVRRHGARAIASSWRWPPDTLVPPSATGSSYPSSFLEIKSSAWAIRAARSTCPSLISSLKSDIRADRPRKQVRLFCGT